MRSRCCGTGKLACRAWLDAALRTEKKALVAQLIAAKEDTGKTYTQISKEIGLTNAYTAQLFYNQASSRSGSETALSSLGRQAHSSLLQAQLKPGTVDALRKAVPGLTDEHVSIMQRCPMRSFDPSLIQVGQAVLAVLLSSRLSVCCTAGTTVLQDLRGEQPQQGHHIRGPPSRSPPTCTRRQ